MKLDFISARGDVLPLSENELFYLAHVDGQTVGEAELATATVGNIDGETVTNARAVARVIVIDLRIASGVDVEEAKREITKFVKLKKRGTLELTHNGRTTQISGVVDRFEMPRWENGVVVQITLTCGQPFWEDVEAVIQQISEAVDLHYFTTADADMLYFPESGVAFGEYDTIRTKSFYNDGDVDVGLEITILAHDTVVNPIIYDQNGDFFGVGYANNPFVMRTGDNVVITTHRGQKTVKYNGVPIFDKIRPQSTWLQLATGDNQFSIDSDDDDITNMSFSLVYKQRYI